jgi:cell division protein FtsZ
VEEVVPAELNITMKKLMQQSFFKIRGNFSMTIEETLKLRADERRKKLKEFNYKFHNNVSKIDEYEREPAYKRLGIDQIHSQIITN